MSLDKKKNVYDGCEETIDFEKHFVDFVESEILKSVRLDDSPPITESEILSTNFVTVEKENSPLGSAFMLEASPKEQRFVFLKNALGGRYYNLFSASASMFTALVQCEKFVDIMVMVLEETHKLAPTAENERMVMAAYNTKNIITMSKVYATQGEKAAIEFGNSVNLATTAPPSGAKQ